ncbi:hypothetical protein G4Y79_23755 [Phototrophicus methaneseepsis]|uniref:Uncharacterized protein n=1 Tax=Phototrophicus methaneseepsis TaxID=2710758 RepID=A0A7S8IDJ4_9CHLR|nr:hypothetical protein [Phototrophicus methaneseepsis]QPC82665.1 hypothetical protein G4Y79_23755 [Phototrophicus methaneseepsis]
MLLRLPLRFLLIAYFLMPLVALGLVIFCFWQIQSDVAPVFETANQSITTAADAVQREVSDLGENFEPLVDAVNDTRNAVNAIISFFRNTLNAVIAEVNKSCFWNGASGCGWSGLPPISLPPLVDLSFIDRIGTNLTTITSQLDTVMTTVTTSVSVYMNLLILAVIVIIVWLILSYLLFFVSLYMGLWQRN